MQRRTLIELAVYNSTTYRWLRCRKCVTSCNKIKGPIPKLIRTKWFQRFLTCHFRAKCMGKHEYVFIKYNCAYLLQLYWILIILVAFTFEDSPDANAENERLPRARSTVIRWPMTMSDLGVVACLFRVRGTPREQPAHLGLVQTECPTLQCSKWFTKHVEHSAVAEYYLSR
jgi:hypothetical protein